MKLAVTALSLFLVLNPSQAKTNPVSMDPESPKHSELRTQTQTKNVRVLASKKAQRRLIVTDDLSDGDDGPPGPDELDLHNFYSYPRITQRKKPWDNDDAVDDYVAVRLATARAKAMQLYHEKWG